MGLRQVTASHSSVSQCCFWQSRCSLPTCRPGVPRVSSQACAQISMAKSSLIEKRPWLQLETNNLRLTISVGAHSQCTHAACLSKHSRRIGPRKRSSVPRSTLPHSRRRVLVRKPAADLKFNKARRRLFTQVGFWRRRRGTPMLLNERFGLLTDFMTASAPSA